MSDSEMAYVILTFRGARARHRAGRVVSALLGEDTILKDGNTVELDGTLLEDVLTPTQMPGRNRPLPGQLPLPGGLE